MDEISRKFRFTRGDREVEYNFITYSCIFSPSPTPLYKHLREAFVNGVPVKEYRTVTELPPVITAKPLRVQNELPQLAKCADYNGFRSKQHERVQRYFLDHDPHTIAVEVPVWNDDVLGHIDLLRLMPDGKLQVLDFKPNAANEDRAACQVHRYMEILVALGAVDRKDIEGYYFDDKSAFSVTI